MGGGTYGLVVSRWKNKNYKEVNRFMSIGG